MKGEKWEGEGGSVSLGTVGLCRFAAKFDKSPKIKPFTAHFDRAPHLDPGDRELVPRL